MMVDIPNNGQSAAWYLSWLAYPESCQRGDRQKFVDGVGFLLHKAHGLTPKKMPDRLRTVKGGPKKIQDEVLNRALKICRQKRLATAYMFLRLSEGRRGDSLKFDGAETIAKAADQWFSLLVQVDENPRNADDSHKTRERIWRPSLPTLPLMLGLMFRKESLEILFSRMEGDPGTQTFNMDGPLKDGWTRLVASNDWVDSAVKTARIVPLGFNNQKHDFLIPSLE